jgi:hypothetical protein
MQEHAFRINIANLQSQPFTQPQAAGVNGRQANAMIHRRNRREDAAHFRRRKNHRQFELGIGASQFQFVRPLPAQGFLPEDLNRADELSAGLAGYLFMLLKMNAILPQVFRRKQLGGFSVMLG